jgi:membrane protein required for colicin V production
VVAIHLLFVHFKTPLIVLTEILASLPTASFKFVDLFIFIILVLGAYRGFQKGLLVEVVSTAAFVVALLILFKLIQMGFTVAGITSKAGSFFMFLLIFILLMIGINWLGGLLKKVLSYTLFDSFDNILGLALGVFKYAIAIAILFRLLTYAQLIDSQSEIHNTIFYPYLMAFLDYVIELVSVLSPFVRDLSEDIQNQLRQ